MRVEVKKQEVEQQGGMRKKERIGARGQWDGKKKLLTERENEKGSPLCFFEVIEMLMHMTFTD